jgi:hypothetical protein
MGPGGNAIEGSVGDGAFAALGTGALGAAVAGPGAGAGTAAGGGAAVLRGGGVDGWHAASSSKAVALAARTMRTRQEGRSGIVRRGASPARCHPGAGIGGCHAAALPPERPAA